MSEISQFSLLTKELRKSKSLISAGRGILAPSSSSTSISDNLTSTESFAVPNTLTSIDNENEFELFAETCSRDTIIREISTPKVDEKASELQDQESVSSNQSQENTLILIKSVGSVNQRYRLLRKEEEKRLALKASRLKRNFNEKPSIPVQDEVVDVEESVPRPVDILSVYDVVLDKLDYTKVSKEVDFFFSSLYTIYSSVWILSIRETLQIL
jgi:hypothetical protein